MTVPPTYHGPEDYENIPPRPPTLSSRAASDRIQALLGLLDHYGLAYTEEPGWLERDPTYHWYDGAPYGVMIHHTATATYSPTSAYPEPYGDRTDGKTICNILVQPDGVINLVSADPANYSSGLNWKGLLDDYVSQNRRFYGPQSGDLGPEWYGNRAWINIETVNPGNGAPMAKVQEDALIAVTAMICAIYGWDATHVIGHCDGRGTKQDPRWDGPYGKPPYSIAGIQDRVTEILEADQLPGEDMFTHFKIGDERAEWEPIVWFLFQIRGGVIDANGHSSQVASEMPWKTNVRLVEAQDFDLIADLLGLNAHERERLNTDGFYRFGKEVAALEQQAWG